MGSFLGPWSVLGGRQIYQKKGKAGKGKQPLTGSCCAEETCQRRVQKSTKAPVPAIDAWRPPVAGRNVEEVSYRVEFAGCRLRVAILMSQADDVWYVRFPDGRVVRVRTTERVRRYLASGRIPRASLVRRSPEEEWTVVEWFPELVNVPDAERPVLPDEPMIPESQVVALRERPAAPSPPPPRPRRELHRDEALHLATVGARGMVEALLSALDSTLIRLKLGVACLAAFLGVVALFLLRHFLPAWDWPWVWVPAAAAGLVVLILGAATTVLLTQWTFVELSQARAARWSDAVTGLLPNTIRLMLADLVIIGLPVAVLLVLPSVPDWLASANWFADAEEVMVVTVLVLSLILWVLLGPLLGFALLLGPILIVEECTTGKALRLWFQFVRQHFLRLFFYEALAVSLAGLMTVPLLVPVGMVPRILMASPLPELGSLRGVLEASWSVLMGLALTPLIAYLVVANVFIYLNLRYQVGTGR
jgi:hypothetical protein